MEWETQMRAAVVHSTNLTVMIENGDGPVAAADYDTTLFLQLIERRDADKFSRRHGHGSGLFSFLSLFTGIGRKPQEAVATASAAVMTVRA
jgi:hypothetical protein